MGILDSRLRKKAQQFLEAVWPDLRKLIRDEVKTLVAKDPQVRREIKIATIEHLEQMSSELTRLGRTIGELLDSYIALSDDLDTARYYQDNVETRLVRLEETFRHE